MNKDIKIQVKKALAEHLGVEPEDIEDEDTLGQDLHMRASDLSDFIETFREINPDAGNIDLTQMETVSDLIEALGGENYTQ